MVQPLLAEERRASRARTPVRIEEDVKGDLQRVLCEIGELMQADGGLLTLHPEDASPMLVYAERGLRDAGRDGECFRLCEAVRPYFEHGGCFWREAADGGALFLMPIERTIGHSQLVIGIYFAQPTAERRALAERLYHERRPFAIGFFHLWQQNRLLEQRARAFEAVLDQTAIGVVLLDRSAQIAFANATAEEILADADGLGRAGPALRAMHLADGVHLHAALSHAMAGAGRREPPASARAPMLAFRRKKGQPLIASILPAPEVPVEAKDIAAIMYLVDPAIDTQRMLSPLCRLYGLSPVETSLVCHLAGGQTLAAAARAIHVKEQTARGYLKAIFIKTGTKRQVDLIVLMLSSAIRMKGGITHEAIVLTGKDETAAEPA